MIFCPKCGSPNLNTAPVCETCGVVLAAAPQQSIPAPAAGLKQDEKRWIFLGNLCFSPVLGLILYLVWKDSQKGKAQDACRLTWWAVGIWGILLVIMVLAAIIAEA